MMRPLPLVTPAKAGVQTKSWIPACAGMTLKYLLLASFLVLAVACGRKDLPSYPENADPRPPQLPRRGTNVPYN